MIKLLEYKDDLKSGQKVRLYNAELQQKKDVVFDFIEEKDDKTIIHYHELQSSEVKSETCVLPSKNDRESMIRMLSQLFSEYWIQEYSTFTWLRYNIYFHTNKDGNEQTRDSLNKEIVKHMSSCAKLLGFRLQVYLKPTLRVRFIRSDYNFIVKE